MGRLMDWANENKKKKYKRELNEYIYEIKLLREKYEQLSDEEILRKSQEFRIKVQSGIEPNDILVDAYALAIEVIRREKTFLLHDNQIMCAMVLSGFKNEESQNCFAEMKTGEGKTLSGVLSAYLNALTGEGVHIVTSNDYLAKRDYENNKRIFERLGISSGFVTSDGTLDIDKKKKIYRSDVVYASTHQIGFDYLRDNACDIPSKRVLRGLNYIIIDEVDDVLLDQSQVPMILSSPSNFKYLSYDVLYRIDDFVTKLTYKNHFGESNTSNFNPVSRETFDFVIHTENNQKNTILGDIGYEKAINFFEQLINEGIIKEKFITSEDHEIYFNDIFLPAINNALLANYTVENSTHYNSNLTSKGIQIDIIDQNTGRPLIGQRFSSGLHQALQVKESRKIINDPKSPEEEKEYSKQIDKIQLTSGLITFPSFLAKYKKFSGMSGTLLESEEEFKTLYGAYIIDIENHKKNQRFDNDLEVFENGSDKLKRILQLVEFHHKNNQPILIGTISIKDSEFIAYELRKLGYDVEVLNALTKEDIEKESDIISKAGNHGSIMVATNLAGRGTDIKLDEIARQNGGLCVIGTALNSSKRSDNQLRGRAGRQGDPGITYLLTSKEDEMYQGVDDSMLESFDKGQALKIQSKLEKAQFTAILYQQDFYNIVDSLRETYYLIRNKIIEQKDPIETLNFMTAYIEDSEMLNYISLLTEYTQNNNISGIKYALKKRLNSLIKDMDLIWSTLLDNLPNLMTQINLRLNYDKSKSSVDGVISETFTSLLETMLNGVLNENMKAEINKIEQIIINSNNKRR